MPSNKNKFCACGSPATVRKNFGAVCNRCARIEASLKNKLMKSKTKSGMAGAIDCYQVHIPIK